VEAHEIQWCADQTAMVDNGGGNTSPHSLPSLRHPKVRASPILGSKNPASPPSVLTHWLTVPVVALWRSSHLQRGRTNAEAAMVMPVVSQTSFFAGLGD